MESWNPGEWWPALANLAGLLVWGGMTHQRLKTLERDIAAMQDLDSRMARVETRLDGLYTQMKDLNLALSWLRAPDPSIRFPVGRRPVTEAEGG